MVQVIVKDFPNSENKCITLQKDHMSKKMLQNLFSVILNLKKKSNFDLTHCYSKTTLPVNTNLSKIYNSHFIFNVLKVLFTIITV